MTEGNSMVVAGEAHLPVDAIRQCGLCHRQHDGSGSVLRWRPVNPLPEDFIRSCGLPDCAAIVDRNLELERVKRQKRLARRENRQERHESKKVCREAAERPLPNLRGRPNQGFLAESENEFNAQDEACLDALGEPAPEDREAARGDVAERPSPAFKAADGASRQALFVAGGGGESARALLFEFFSRTENWMKAFRSTFLEDYTRRMGHESSRMNNRAPELRLNFAAQGVYVDNDPNGSSAWCAGLPRGSYYRLCYTEDATSLTEAEKVEWLAKKTK